MRFHAAKRFLSPVLFAALLSLAAVAQVVPEAYLLAPTSVRQFEGPDCNGPPGGPPQQNKKKTVSSSDGSLTAPIKRVAVDQKQIYEYPRPWVQFLAYGTATTVSVTRVTGLEHFPADVAVGGVFGYLIGQHMFHSHSRFFHGHHDQKIPCRGGA